MKKGLALIVAVFAFFGGYQYAAALYGEDIAALESVRNFVSMG